MRVNLCLAVALTALLAACGGSNGSGTGGSGPWQDDVKPASAATKIGATGTACPMPVAIDIPDKWTPKAPSSGDTQGGLDLACEIDGKPAGTVGFLRVWTVTGLPPRQALQAYLSDEKDAGQVQYRDTTIGAGSGAEVIWVNPDVGHLRAFATVAGQQTVVVTGGGIDDTEYQHLLPALLLAKRSLVALSQ
jgi:hypothetical protein